jgi:hypothetical protein
MFKNRIEKPIEMKSWFSEDTVNLLAGLLANEVLEGITYIHPPQAK